jgi:pimeloyl-ACP methyl ester carboxylesterase
MRVWTVQLRPPAGQRAPKVLLVHDGFSWGALLVPTLWLLSQGLFALALLHGAVVVALAVLLPDAVAPFVLLGVQVFMGFEARSLQSWWLGLRGFRPAAVLVARDEEAAFLNLASFRPDLARAAV